MFLLAIAILLWIAMAGLLVWMNHRWQSRMEMMDDELAQATQLWRAQQQALSGRKYK
jgi:hypothetical protein